MTTDIVVYAPAAEVAPRPASETIAAQQETIRALEMQGQIQAVRHQLAQAFTAMQIKGYNALLNYGIDYQSLPSYADPSDLLDRAAEAPLLEGQSAYFEYIRRVVHDIDAAIRRKQMTLTR